MSVTVPVAAREHAVPPPNGEPEITVVIPTHKRRDFLERAVGSVCTAAEAGKLAASALEIIVADDGHTDDTRALCERLAKSIPHRLRYLRTPHGPSLGPGAGRNAGIADARGQFIFFLDDDDEFLPNRFEVCLPLLRSGEWDGICEHTIRVYADGSKPSFVTGPPAELPQGPDGPFLHIMDCQECHHITPNATAYRAEFIRRLGGFASAVRYGQDGDFLVRASVLGRLKLISGSPVARTWIHDDNHTRVDRRREHYNVIALRHCYRALDPVKHAMHRGIVLNVMRGKLDQAMTRLRQGPDSYSDRVKKAAQVIWHFPVDCLNWQNIKSIGVCLLKPRGH